MTTEFLAGVGVRDITPEPELIDNSLHSCMTVRLHERGSPMRVKALALTFGNVRSLLLAVDLVSICTYTPTHVPLALKALAAGKHVLVEKPVALCEEDAMKLVQAAKDAGKMRQEGHDYKIRDGDVLLFRFNV